MAALKCYTILTQPQKDNFKHIHTYTIGVKPCQAIDRLGIFLILYMQQQQRTAIAAIATTKKIPCNQINIRNSANQSNQPTSHPVSKKIIVAATTKNVF